MSELQASLLAIGGVVIAGVYAFNWLQERRLRRRLEEAFGGTREDALMQEPAQEPRAERVEPQLESLPEDEPAVSDSPDAAPAMAQAVGEPVAARAVPASALDTALEFIVQIASDAPMPEAALAELVSQAATCGKPCRAMGLNETRGEWEELARARASGYSRVELGLQLVNRNGGVSAAQLAAFCDAVTTSAAKMRAQATCGDAQEALARAQDLDTFCANVDVTIGVNVVAPANQAFAGSRIRGLAEAVGFKLEPDGVFRFRDNERRTLFTLDNHEPAPFIPEQIRNVTTGGVTLLLDVPCVANGRQVLHKMFEVARQLARGLGGELVDDNRAPLNVHGIAAIEQQLDSIVRRMAAAGIDAGGERALRLFS